MKLSREDYEQAKNCLKKYNYNSYIEKENQQHIKELEAVRRAKMLIDNDSLYILNHLYIQKDMNKWEILATLSISEETYKRRHKELIDKVYEELTKI